LSAKKVSQTTKELENYLSYIFVENFDVENYFPLFINTLRQN